MVFEKWGGFWKVWKGDWVYDSHLNICQLVNSIRFIDFKLCCTLEQNRISFLLRMIKSNTVKYNFVICDSAVLNRFKYILIIFTEYMIKKFF